MEVDQERVQNQNQNKERKKEEENLMLIETIHKLLQITLPSVSLLLLIGKKLILINYSIVIYKTYSPTSIFSDRFNVETSRSSCTKMLWV